MKRLPHYTVWYGFIFVFCCTSAFSTPKDELQPSDIAYLEQVMKDTWNYIDFYVAPETGFPYDSNTKPEKSNTTNVGLYLASIAVAHRLGYIKEEDAILKISKVLRSLEKIQNWNYLYNNWLSVTGDTNAYAGPNNISDYNKLPAGLILVRQEFPQLSDECSKMLNKINWSIFYEPETGKIFYEFDIINKTVNRPVFISRGEDKLLGAFLMVASGKVPSTTWDHHLMGKADMEERYGLKYFKPGWQGGGLFMQFICGMFLDETGTKLGYSEANFAFAQIVHAKKIGSPVWGWSASQNPDGGYLGMGQIRDSVVTPHACMLAIGFYPKAVVNNLRKLEQMGARAPIVINGREHAFGFHDALNTDTGKVDPDFLVLDQAMAFLSLANFLEDDVVRKMFKQDPMVANGLKLIPEYSIKDADKMRFRDYVHSLNTRQIN